MVSKKKGNKVKDLGRERQASMITAISGERSTEEQGHTKNDSIPKQPKPEEVNICDCSAKLLKENVPCRILATLIALGQIFATLVVLGQIFATLAVLGQIFAALVALGKYLQHWQF